MSTLHGYPVVVMGTPYGMRSIIVYSWDPLEWGITRVNGKITDSSQLSQQMQDAIIAELLERRKTI
jgi:hypothetical protein